MLISQFQVIIQVKKYSQMQQRKVRKNKLSKQIHMLIICRAFLWSVQNVSKSVYRKSPILTSSVPQKIDNRALKLATSSGRNSHGKSRLYIGIVTHSRHRGLVHYVMTLVALPEASRSVIVIETGRRGASNWPRDPITAASFVGRQTGTIPE